MYPVKPASLEARKEKKKTPIPRSESLLENAHIFEFVSKVLRCRFDKDHTVVTVTSQSPNGTVASVLKKEKKEKGQPSR